MTIDNLRRRGVCVIDWWYLCKGDGESVNHVLLHCSVARGLWVHVFGILNLHWIMPERVTDVLLSWGRKFANPIAKAIWKMILSCIWWCLWRERNSRCFEDSAMSFEHLKDGLMHSLFCRLVQCWGGPFLDFQDFISFFACMLYVISVELCTDLTFFFFLFFNKMELIYKK